MFALNLKKLRTSRDLLQKDVANYLGITTSAYGFYEQGKRQPDPETISKLANFFNVTTDYLLGRTEIPNANVINVTDQIPKEILKELDIDVAYREVLINAKEAKISPEELAAFVDALSKIKKQGG